MISPDSIFSEPLKADIWTGLSEQQRAKLTQTARGYKPSYGNSVDITDIHLEQLYSEIFAALELPTPSDASRYSTRPFTARVSELEKMKTSGHIDSSEAAMYDNIITLRQAAAIQARALESHEKNPSEATAKFQIPKNNQTWQELPPFQKELLVKAAVPYVKTYAKEQQITEPWLENLYKAIFKALNMPELPPSSLQFPHITYVDSLSVSRDEEAKAIYRGKLPHINHMSPKLLELFGVKDDKGELIFPRIDPRPIAEQYALITGLREEAIAGARKSLAFSRTY